MALSGDFLLPQHASADSLGVKYNAHWQQTMLRVADPDLAITFFVDHFGMKKVHEYHFDDFSLYFLEKPRANQAFPSTYGTEESEKYLWNMSSGCCLELTHNHKCNKDDICNGNDEPYRGFGHIAFNCNDVYMASEKLEAARVKFKKKPDDGRMKGLAFVYSPDDYWIEIVGRRCVDNFTLPQEEFNFSQTMLRVKDPRKSVPFYRDVLGMSLVRAVHSSDFSLYFMVSIPTQEDKEKVPKDIESDESSTYVKALWTPVLELTHNHGTENDHDQKYYNGNDDDTKKGFGHVGFIVDDLSKCCQELEKMTYNNDQKITFQKKQEQGNMHNIAFIKDPDGYWVELIQKGTTFKP